MRGEVNCTVSPSSWGVTYTVGPRTRNPPPPLSHRNYIKAWSLDSVYFHRKQINQMEYQTIWVEYFFYVKDMIYHVGIATVIFSCSKITCYFHMRKYYVFLWNSPGISLVVTVYIRNVSIQSKSNQWPVCICHHQSIA